jgi:hypothetical protein
MSGIISIATLIIGGVIIADILTHPAGTAAASSGIGNLWGTSINGLLGGATVGNKVVKK